MFLATSYSVERFFFTTFVFDIVTQEQKICYLCKKERFRNRATYYLKVRTNLYTTLKLATIIS